MFTPDVDESPHHPHTTTISEPLKTEGVVQPKSISHTSTRLPSPPPEPAVLVPPSPTRSRIDAAISGMAYKPSSTGEGVAGPSGYNYVPTVPSPSPDQLGPTALKELMTTGQLLATPRLLSSTRIGEDVPNPEATPFHIQAPSRREQTGLKLSMKASRAIREKTSLLNGTAKTPATRKKGDMAPPEGTPRRAVNDLTPAARALLARSTGGKADGTPLRRGGGLFDRERDRNRMERDLGKVKWTPSPMTRR